MIADTAPAAVIRRIPFAKLPRQEPCHACVRFSFRLSDGDRTPQFLSNIHVAPSLGCANSSYSERPQTFRPAVARTESLSMQRSASATCGARIRGRRDRGRVAQSPPSRLLPDSPVVGETDHLVASLPVKSTEAVAEVVPGEGVASRACTVRGRAPPSNLCEIRARDPSSRSGHHDVRRLRTRQHIGPDGPTAFPKGTHA